MRRLGLAARELSSRLMLVMLIVALVGFLGLFLWQSLQIQRVQAEHDRKAGELANVRERNALLQEHLDFYKGPGYTLYVEKVAREALGLVKPGETLVLPVEEGTPAAAPGSAAPSSANAPPQANAARKSNWQNWLQFFFGS
jgi:cell division protein DivIC